MTNTKPKLRWFQFSLRTLMVFVTLFAIPCGWLGMKMQQARQERKAAAAIEKLGGRAGWSKPSGPAWLRRVLGDGLFTHVEFVFLYPPEGIFRPGLGYRTQPADAWLENLRGLSRLQRLDVFSYQVTDAGLENLKELNQLRELWLAGTKVTDEGVDKLQQALPNCKIERRNGFAFR